MKMTDADTLLAQARTVLARYADDDAQTVVNRIDARLAADQQKGGGCNCEVSAGLAAFHKDDCRAMAPQPSIPAPAQQDCLPPGTPMMPSGAFHNALWKTMAAELQPHGRMLTQLWSVADSTEMKNALETAILSMSAQQDGKASGGEVDDAMVKRAKVAYNAACDAGRQPCPNCKGTRRERDNYTECGTCEGAGWKWDESAPGPMRAALTAALAHPPHADQETQG